MPELRLSKTRATLPSGYQFGDVRRTENQDEILKRMIVAAALEHSRYSRGFAMRLEHASCPRCGHPIYHDSEGEYCPNCGPVLKPHAA